MKAHPQTEEEEECYSYILKEESKLLLMFPQGGEQAVMYVSSKEESKLLLMYPRWESKLLLMYLGIHKGEQSNVWVITKVMPLYQGGLPSQGCFFF